MYYLQVVYGKAVDLINGWLNRRSLKQRVADVLRAMKRGELDDYVLSYGDIERIAVEVKYEWRGIVDNSINLNSIDTSKLIKKKDINLLPANSLFEPDSELAKLIATK